MAILGVDDIKAQLRGGGARPNLFQVTMNFPAGSNWKSKQLDWGGKLKLVTCVKWHHCQVAQLHQLRFHSGVVSCK